ncbi:MAG: ABC transporter ATP-binding protein [Haloechinothrix sp.]
MSDAILSVQNLSVAYGRVQAVRDVSFDALEGSLITLVGANGAGKTSVLNAVAGLLKPFSGKVLAERRHLLASALSGGEQQMLAISRALVAKPLVLLMDEPSMGLAPKVVDEVFRVIKEIRASGTTVVLVEQNARRALRAADVGYVLETGSLAHSAMSLGRIRKTCRRRS